MVYCDLPLGIVQRHMKVISNRSLSWKDWSLKFMGNRLFSSLVDFGLVTNFVTLIKSCHRPELGFLLCLKTILNSILSMLSWRFVSHSLILSVWVLLIIILLHSLVPKSQKSCSGSTGDCHCLVPVKVSHGALRSTGGVHAVGLLKSFCPPVEKAGHSWGHHG